MNSSDRNDLSRTLADWRVNPTADSNFRPAVWQRIQQRTYNTWAAYMQARLAGWSIAAVIVVGGATFTGHSLAQAKIDQERDQMVVSYLGNLDPRVMAEVRLEK